MEKAQSLACDSIIFDLEDAVAVAAKNTARDCVCRAVNEGDYGYRELVVRVNGLDTEWGAQDIAAIARLGVDAILLPKVETSEQVAELITHLDAQEGTQLGLWLMIETPKGVLDVRQLAASSDRIECLVLGTSDLVKELRASHTENRQNIAYALQHSVLAAREAGVDVLDGVHLDFRNLVSFEQACEQARTMGFDGKTLIHPGQVEIANQIFGFSADVVLDARAIIEVWRSAQAAGKGVAVFEGRLIENLHVAEAERVLAFADALAARTA